MDFLSFFKQEENKNLLDEVLKTKEVVLSGIGNHTTKAFLYADFYRLYKKNLLIVINDEEKADEVLESLDFWLGDEPVSIEYLDLSKEESEPFNIIEFVHKIHHDDIIYVVRESDLEKKVPSYSHLDKSAIIVNKNEDFLNVEIFNTLIQCGYEVSHDVHLKKGEYRRSGGVLDIFPINSDYPYKIEIEFDKVANIWMYDQEKKQVGKALDSIEIFPLSIDYNDSHIFDVIPQETLVFLDEVDDSDYSKTLNENNLCRFIYTSFPQTDKNYFHLRYLSVLKFYNLTDFLNDIREKMEREWRIIILSKRSNEIENIFDEERIRFHKKLNSKGSGIFVIDAGEYVHVPVSFQNPTHKLQFITDKEIFSLKKSAKNKTLKKMSLEFLSSLKEGDFVVHFDHGIGRFLGIIQRVIDGVAREYLEIAYAENDKLFVPIDQADKVSRYISGEEAEDNEPRLSRLGSQEWKNITKKVKKETEKIAKDLLHLYAKRAQAKGFVYNEDDDIQRKFEAAFPYEETPGQMKAIQDIKNDMEGSNPMDRLVCGDVGFGKTEVAMRAAFKAVRNKKQVAFISPITILADQHYRTLKKRMSAFGVRIEMLSRFRTPSEQRAIVKKLRTGDVDIIIGTHRLLQPDIQFLDLGMVIIDEEQRFGVKQKEVLKNLRTSVDILTLTATPIPRTLNLSLNKLRDITIITTPPPGRLPIITEVRKYSDYLIRESIMTELERKGQIYFLHNRVETIEGIAHKLKTLIPEARFVVAHGQLNSGDLEERIIDFKEHKYDVLVSSTIIENGIDLANANTLIVNNAEAFGLSQLYQLRGRIGRGKVQAYAYFMYHTQKLKDDAKKRLKAIVEASELGAGFQIAMRDLEIRGAGEILGANQHGMMNIVGVGHFIRLLNQTIEELKAGRKKERLDAQEDTIIELPVEALIPNTYISDQKEKISVYQKLSAVDNHDLLKEIFDDLKDEYGAIPKSVETLYKVLDIKLIARKLGVTHIKAETNDKKGKNISITVSNEVRPENIVNVLGYNESWKISGNRIVIDIQKLGFNWLDELKESVLKLS